MARFNIPFCQYFFCLFLCTRRCWFFPTPLMHSTQVPFTNLSSWWKFELWYKHRNLNSPKMSLSSPPCWHLPLGSLEFKFLLHSLEMLEWRWIVERSKDAGVKRLYDLVKARDKSLQVAFYYALSNTLVANDLEQASRIAYGPDKRWARVVTTQVSWNKSVNTEPE